MYLFTRRALMRAGRLRDSVAWATDITNTASQTSGLDIGLWVQVFSPDVGMVGWTAWVPDLEALETATDKLQIDDTYIAAQDAGAEFTEGRATDALQQLVAGELDPERQVNYVSAATAVPAPGRISAAIQKGVEIAQRAEAIAGTTTLFAAGVTGPYGNVAWYTGHETIGAMEAAEAALMADPSWLELIDSAGEVFAAEPELTVQTIWRRLV